MIQHNIETDWHGKFRIGSYHVNHQANNQTTSRFLYYWKNDYGHEALFDTKAQAERAIAERAEDEAKSG